jgi:molecular chaperone GrpE
MAKQKQAEADAQPSQSGAAIDDTQINGTTAEAAVPDVPPPSNDAETAASPASDAIHASLSPEKLLVQLVDTKKQAEALRQSHLRALAEMENLRRRTQREMEQARKFAIEGFANDLLQIMDNLERALDAMEKERANTDQNGGPVKALADGVVLTRNALLQTFNKHGITRIDALHQPFDPNLHQAMMQMPAPNSQPPNTVVLEMQSGYLLNDRLLRPAMVGVSV